jgi:hypothetical protein
MEERVRQLEVTAAVQGEKIEALTAAVQANTTAVSALTAAMNQSKGAWLAIVAASSIVSFLTALVISFIGVFKHPT